MLLSTILAAVISLTPSDVPNPDNWHINRGDYKSNGVWYAQEPQPEPPKPPQSFDAGIETPVLVLQTADGKGVGVVADGLDLVTYVDHASPRPDAATLAARVAAAKSERQSLRDVLKDIRVETTNNIADCVTISASTTNTANAAQGTQIRKLSDEVADTNRQLNRLRKALLDYLRGTE
jgi:nucleoid-associated protein YgaU